MMKSLLPIVSRYSAIILAIFAMSYILPAGFDKIFVQQAGSPLLFFSPLQKQFIYRESLGGHRFNYINEDGTSYDRAGFELQLPFLYYKNLERKNLLPVIIDGQIFDKKTIKANRQGLEIKSRHLDNHHPQIQLYPLFNNDPAVAIMPFPEDMFRFTNHAMEFINADFNQIDKELTENFTAALKKQGFVFPATVIGGKTTNLKPFDEGFFIRDYKGYIFHLKRVLNKPVVVKTPIDSALAVKDLIISENRRREFYGVIITKPGDLYLISYDNYRLIPLPIEYYQPGVMDFKLLINPLYRTAVISDAKKVHGTAMDTTYQPLRRYTLERLNPTPAMVQITRNIFFPFQLRLDTPYRAQADLQLQFGNIWSLGGILAAFVLFLFWQIRKNQQSSLRKDELVLICMTGFFGLFALFFVRSTIDS